MHIIKPSYSLTSSVLLACISTSERVSWVYQWLFFSISFNFRYISGCISTWNGLGGGALWLWKLPCCGHQRLLHLTTNLHRQMSLFLLLLLLLLDQPPSKMRLPCVTLKHFYMHFYLNFLPESHRRSICILGCSLSRGLREDPNPKAKSQKPWPKLKQTESQLCSHGQLQNNQSLLTISHWFSHCGSNVHKYVHTCVFQSMFTSSQWEKLMRSLPFFFSCKTPTSCGALGPCTMHMVKRKRRGLGNIKWISCCKNSRWFWLQVDSVGCWLLLVEVAERAHQWHGSSIDRGWERARKGKRGGRDFPIKSFMKSMLQNFFFLSLTVFFQAML